MVIGGGVALIFKKPTKRKAGQRAGMTRGKIVEAAVKLWDSVGPEGFTIRRLAARLKVVPTTIRAHVKGGIAELRREIARRVLADLTPPYKPDQLRAKFRFRGAKIEAPKFPQCIAVWSAICSKYCPPGSPRERRRFHGIRNCRRAP